MSFAPLYLDIHALQTVPPSCINRDDTGSPKTARFGGVRRARVSSQAWKKAIRDEFANILNEDEIGWRTKHLVDMVASRILRLVPDIETREATKMAETTVKATGIKLDKNSDTNYLIFVSPRQAEGLAALAVETQKSGVKLDAKKAKSILNVKERPTLNAVDIALFGRMVADAPELNVDAATQVAHAIGVTAAETEFDYFTAMDDLSPEDSTGAGMIGTVEFLSDTLYRYATVDICHLCENLGSADVAAKAAGAFVEAFACSMPTGKQNTFANRTLPDVIMIQFRDTQPVSLVGAFERPVYPTDKHSISEVACKRMVKRVAFIDDAFGTEPFKTVMIAGTPAIREQLASLSYESLNLQEAIALSQDIVASRLSNRDNS
ncbi:MAG: type I-E CRISPR-associated protein Cas7/Cse4/CasC [Atopobiaceae bacterium]|nr:type I-E CRISPR-associated protein Cas7/Cse4/CasC [Atopobiaceae bacterium]